MPGHCFRLTEEPPKHHWNGQEDSHIVKPHLWKMRKKMHHAVLSLNYYLTTCKHFDLWFCLSSRASNTALSTQFVQLILRVSKI